MCYIHITQSIFISGKNNVPSEQGVSYEEEKLGPVFDIEPLDDGEEKYIPKGDIFLVGYYLP